MTTADKKQKIKQLVVDTLKTAYEAQLKMVDKALNSGAIDIDAWDEKDNPMITPKVIVIAILEEEANQYKCTGSRFEKKMKKDINNLKAFL